MVEGLFHLIMEFHHLTLTLHSVKILEFMEEVVQPLFEVICRLFLDHQGTRILVHRQIANTVQTGIPEDLQQL